METDVPSRAGMKTLVAVATAAMAVLAPEAAWAWGAGIHVAQGSFILENLSMIRPEIAAILSANPLDYIYGCISADIFIGKGYRRRPDHCHNWSVGLKTLQGSSTEPTRAYSYGYLTHLAADVIAHNYFIPKLLCVTPTSNQIGHVFWEFRADQFILKKHWRLAREVVTMHNHENDNHIKTIMKRSHFRFGAKKMFFKRAVTLSDLYAWREHVETAYARKRRVTKKDVTVLNNLSLNLIIDMLKNKDNPVCMDYDPVGTDNMIRARAIRRSGRLMADGMDLDGIFKVPDGITGLDFVDLETVRF